MNYQGPFENGLTKEMVNSIARGESLEIVALYLVTMPQPSQASLFQPGISGNFTALRKITSFFFHRKVFNSSMTGEYSKCPFFIHCSWWFSLQSILTIDFIPILDFACKLLDFHRDLPFPGVFFLRRCPHQPPSPASVLSGHYMREMSKIMRTILALIIHNSTMICGYIYIYYTHKERMIHQTAYYLPIESLL